jgi:single-strand DNA-binding protein
VASFNKAIIAGNCGKDPEVRYLQSGMAVANVSVATSRKRKDKNTGETIEETQWHRVVFYDKLAEIVGEYVKKGTSILVEGFIKYGQYEKEDGTKVYTTDIVAESMQMLGSRNDNGGQQRQQPQQQPQGQRQAPQQQRPQGNAYQDARGGGAPRQAPQRSGSGFDDMDDDIPF